MYYCEKEGLWGVETQLVNMQVSQAGIRDLA